MDKLIIGSLMCLAMIALASMTEAKEFVYMIQSQNGNNRISSGQAHGQCQLYGTRLATRSELDAAQKQGLSRCNCGWLKNGDAAYPMTRAVSGCGSTTGIITCDTSPNALHNVWCVNLGAGKVSIETNQPIPGYVYNIYLATDGTNVYSQTQAQAKARCELEGNELANMDDMQYAFRLGLSQCHCGWVDAGHGAYPMTYQAAGCGSPGVNICTWRNLWDAWCRVAS